MKIFLAAPTARQQEIRDVLCGAAPGSTVYIGANADSRLAYNFNAHWVSALNSRAEWRWTDFAMIHEDVTPLNPHWLKWLAEERRRVGADILSVVLPIRNNDEGYTSTAIGATRLTLKQAYERETTFSDAQLLVNTGLWICDFTKSWVEKMIFEMREEIKFNGSKWEAWNWPEDWNFSRRAHELGLSVYATTGLKADHGGYLNDYIK